VEYPNETSRLLAAALRCCWADVQASPWPGQPATVREVLDVVDQLMPGRGEEDQDLPALRELCRELPPPRPDREADR
jgi:hypothetical protein